VRYEVGVHLACRAALVAVVTACASAPPRSEADLRGEAVARAFCLSCHVLDAPRERMGLRVRLRPDVWATPDEAEQNVRQPWRVSRAMTVAFQGSDADRRALAVYLVRVAGENRVPWWREAAPLAGLAGVVAAAALWARRRVRRR
jgi:mono/diheme cytochrome c family protein